MSRNVEIKARIDDPRAFLKLANLVADGEPVEIRQDDTFFHCPNGRLKLRELSPDEGQLIFYQRDDASGPKESRYLISTTSDPAILRNTLACALGVAGRVLKRRILFLVGSTRIHLDEVDGLGVFAELEVVLDDEQSVEDGEATAKNLMQRLGISETHLLSGAYVDMLNTRG